MAPNREVSMSTRFLYHAFDIRGYEHVRTDYRGGHHLHHPADPHDCRSSACGSRGVTHRGHAERHFVALPIGTGSTR
jgi:hypothetical protein